MATCPGCGDEATVRVNGRVREHRIARGWLCPGSGRLPVLERAPAPPATSAAPARITEEQLFQAYGVRPEVVQRPPAPPIPTVETVRSHLAAAVDEDPADRPDSREEVRP